MRLPARRSVSVLGFWCGGGRYRGDRISRSSVFSDGQPFLASRAVFDQRGQQGEVKGKVLNDSFEIALEWACYTTAGFLSGFPRVAPGRELPERGSAPPHQPRYSGFFQTISTAQPSVASSRM